MGKGILLEVEGRTGVVLTPQGEFKRVPLPQAACEIGDEVAYKESATPRWGWIAAAAAVLLMLASPFGYQAISLAQPAALVMIDINPSLQLTLNGREQVIDAQGLNPDGKLVLEGVAWNRRSVDDVTRQVTAKAVAAGKLNPAAEGSAVVVAVAPVGDKELPQAKAHDIAARSKAAVQTEVRAQAEAKGAAPKTQVAAVEATADEVKQAKEQGITLPKLIILQAVQADHPEVTADALKEKGPGQFLKGLNMNPGEIFGKAEERHNKKEESQPAATKEKGKPSDDSGSKENPGKKEEKAPSDKGQGKSDKQDEQSPPAPKQESPDSKGKGNPSSKDSEPGKSNSGKGGQEKGDPKANEGSKGRNKP